MLIKRASAMTRLVWAGYFPKNLLSAKESLPMLTVLKGGGEWSCLESLISHAPNLKEIEWNPRVLFGSCHVCVIARSCLNLEKLSFRTYTYDGLSLFDEKSHEMENWRHLKDLQTRNILFSNSAIMFFTSARPPLTCVQLRGDESTIDSLTALFDHCSATLESVTLDGVKVGKKMILAFSMAKNMYSLEFEKVSETVDDEAMIALANGCPNMTTLTCCGLASVTDKAFIAMAHAFSKMMHLELGGATLITDAAVVEFARRFRNLESLGLDYCPLLTDVSLRALHFYVRDRFFEFRGGGTQIDDQLARKWSQQSGRQVYAKADFYD